MNRISWPALAVIVGLVLLAAAVTAFLVSQSSCGPAQVQPGPIVPTPYHA